MSSMSSDQTKRQPAGMPIGGQFASHDRTEFDSDLARDTAADNAAEAAEARHREMVAKMRDVVLAVFPNASGVVFQPHENELDRQWYDNDDNDPDGDFQDAWLDRGDLTRTPVSVFIDGDPENIIDLDDDDHYAAGEPYDREAFAETLAELSQRIDRGSVEFEAIGDYEIFVWLDED